MKDDILIKYLLGEASVEEVKLVEDWLGEKKHQAYYRNLQNIWMQSKMLEMQPEHTYSTEAAWEGLQLKMRGGVNSAVVFAGEDKTNEPVELLNRSSRGIFNMFLWKWAAVIAILFGCWMVLNSILTTDQPAEVRVLMAAATPISDTLSDGSVITLNHYARVEAPVKFNGKTREVALKAGEAFFNVVHQAKKPFLVHIGPVDITVLGTSFNVKKDGSRTVIEVATGKVMVLYQNQRVVLHPDEKVTIGPTTKLLVGQKSQGLLYNYYVTQKFIANNTRLEDLVDVLNEAYNRHIVFSRPELKELRITTVFAKEPLEVILNVISETFGIKVVYQADKIELQ